MSRLNRAAQFSPFAALTGYDALVDESARVTAVRHELSEDGTARIDAKLQLLQNHLEDKPIISVLYFEKDQRKAGGAYVETVGLVKKIDTINSTLLLHSGKEIPLDVTTPKKTLCLWLLQYPGSRAAVCFLPTNSATRIIPFPCCTSVKMACWGAFSPSKAVGPPVIRSLTINPHPIFIIASPIEAE